MQTSLSLRQLFSQPSQATGRLLPRDEAHHVLTLLNMLDAFTVEISKDRLMQVFEQKKIYEHEFRMELHKIWSEDVSIIDQFIASEAGQTLKEDEKNIVMSWKKCVRGLFICMKYYDDCAVFTYLDTQENKSVGYFAVLGLNEDFEHMINVAPPYAVETVLLPYKDLIIWDNLCRVAPVDCSRMEARALVDRCKLAKRNGEITTKFTFEHIA